jgi:transcriptional regulator with XRE-family HTH domain
VTINPPREPKNRVVHPLVAELLQTRWDRRVTAKFIADRIGVVPTVYSRWEQGICNPQLSTFVAWANALKFNVVLQPMETTGDE